MPQLREVDSVLHSPRFRSVLSASRHALAPQDVGGPLGAVLLLALAACNGTAVVTLTSTPSTDTFLTYRVGLVSVQLQTSNGRKSASSSAVEHHGGSCAIGQSERSGGRRRGCRRELHSRRSSRLTTARRKSSTTTAASTVSRSRRWERMASARSGHAHARPRSQQQLAIVAQKLFAPQLGFQFGGIQYRRCGAKYRDRRAADGCERKPHRHQGGAYPWSARRGQYDK